MKIIKKIFLQIFKFPVKYEIIAVLQLYKILILLLCVDYILHQKIVNSTGIYLKTL